MKVDTVNGFLVALIQKRVTDISLFSKCLETKGCLSQSSVIITHMSLITRAH